MRKIALLVLACMTCFSVCAQNLPSKKEQYDFLKWYVSYRHLFLLDSSYKFIGIFSCSINNVPLYQNEKRSEKNYLSRQAKLLKNQLRLDSSTLRQIGWKSVEKPENSYINYFSLPIFSLDRKMAIISWGIYCGKDCGKESFDVFIKTKNNKWRLSNTVVPVVIF